MSSFLQQLENNEAVLLMYLFDELPPEDRAEVDQMLATDAGLRAQLEGLREAQAQIDPAMRKLDAVTRLPVPEAVAARQVSRLIEQWNVDRLAGRPAEVVAPRRKLAKWIGYPAGAVAAALLVALLWWGLTDQTGNTAEFVNNGPFASYPGEDNSLMESITNDAFVRDVVREADLQRVENQMVALRQSSTDDPFIVPIEIDQ